MYLVNHIIIENSIYLKTKNIWEIGACFYIYLKEFFFGLNKHASTQIFKMQTYLDWKKKLLFNIYIKKKGIIEYLINHISKYIFSIHIVP